MKTVASLRAVFEWPALAVLKRHVLVYRRSWKTGLVPPAIEPVVFFVAFGLGLRAHVGEVPFGGRSLDYADFVAPGLLAYTAFSSAFYEGLYSSYVRMFYQKTWDGMLGTQVELSHVLWGEVLFAGCRAAMNATMVSSMLLLFDSLGLISIQPVWLLVAPGLVFVGGCAFASFALVFTAIVPSIEHINYPVFLVGIPLGLLSNTYFPVPSEVLALKIFLSLNPVAQLSNLMRELLVFGYSPQSWLSNFVPFLGSAVLLLALSMLCVFPLMRRRVFDAQGH